MTARQRDAEVRACCQIQAHGQGIQVTGEPLPLTAGGFQMAAARVAPAVETFATHQARPAQVQVAVQARVQVQVAVQVVVVVVQAQMETAVAVKA